MKAAHRATWLMSIMSGFLMTASFASAAPVPSPPAASPRPGDCTLESNINDINEGPTDYGMNLRPIGDVDVILLFIDFPDSISTDETQPIADRMSPLLEDYYKEVSYGELNVTIDAVHEWYRMPGNSGTYDYTTHNGQKEVFTDATTAADPEVDFSGYDIILTAEGPGGTHPYSPAWLGANNAVITDEGPIKWGSTLGQDIYDPPRGHMTPVHEMGHLFGLPDLYDFDSPAHRHVGSWDVMGNLDATPGMSAWHRNKMGWLADDQVTCVAYSGATDVTLTPLALDDAAGKLAIVKTSASTAYAIEYRTTEGLDANLCDEGILVYRINTNVASGEGPIELLRAHAPPGGFSCPSDFGGYEPLQTPAFDIGPGEVSTFTDADDDLSIEVLTIDPEQATVRIDYEGGPPQPLDYERNVIITKVNKKKGVIKGRVEAEPGAPDGCTADVPVKLRAASGAKTLASAGTASDGSFKIKVKPKGKRRYVYAPEKSAGSDYCLTASSTTFKV